MPGEGGVSFEALPPPTQGEVERLLRVVGHRVLRLLEKEGPCSRKGQRTRCRRIRRTPCNSGCAGRKWNLHANDRQGLARLCRYGARGALALERLSRAQDGRIALADEAPAAGRYPGR